MKWYNASRDFLPEDKQEVLISVKGIYYPCVFDAQQKVFRMLEEPERYFDLQWNTIYWTDLGDLETGSW